MSRLALLAGAPSPRADLVAGATTAAVVIPQAMAYATIAGLPVQYGLYCALVPMLVYALLGTSRPLSVSTTSSISLITAATVLAVDGDPPAVASTLAVLVGVLLLGAGLLRLGFVSDLVSDSVLAGFKVGMGLVIVVDQLGRLLGVSVSGDNALEKAWSAVRQLDEASGITIVIAAVSIAALLALARFVPRVPAPLVVVAGGLAVVAAADLGGHGVALVPPVPEGLPGLAAPELGLADDLLPAALGVALLSLTESIAAARSFRSTEDPPVEANGELVALGAANLAGGLFQAYPAGGGLSQTAVNDRAGARSQLASLATAGAVALTLLLLAPLFDNLAEATLGAVVVVAAIGLARSPELERLRRVRTRDWSFGLVALAGVVVLGTLQGILVAVVVSLLVLLYQASRPPVVAYTPAPGMLAARVEGGLYFANARRTFARILELVDAAEPRPRVLVLDLSAVPDTDVTALHATADLDRSLAERGVVLWIAGALERPLAMLRRLDTIPERRAFRDMASALEAYAAPRETVPT